MKKLFIIILALSIWATPVWADDPKVLESEVTALQFQLDVEKLVAENHTLKMALADTQINQLNANKDALKRALVSSQSKIKALEGQIQALRDRIEAAKEPPAPIEKK